MVVLYYDYSTGGVMNPMNSFSQMVNMLQTVQLTNLMIQAVMPSILPNASQKPAQEEPTVVAAGTVIDGVAISGNSTVISGGRVFKAL